MGRGVFRFLVRSPEGAEIFEPQAAIPGAVVPQQPQVAAAGMDLMRQTPPMSDRDEVIFLLHTAAEIEHTLLAQYLYAAYSLEQKGKRAEWRETLLTIAREEMAHLFSVQNLLRALGGPLNFEREDYPFNVFYPFPFQLEPFTLKSIARYMLAEMPDPSAIPSELGFDVEQVKHDAEVTAPGEMINRVGTLFTLLLKLVDNLIDQPANQTQRSDFRPEGVKWQAQPGEGWAVGKMILELVNNQAEAKALVERIGTQGEGPGNPGGEPESHFRKFFKIYTEIKAKPEDAVSRIVPVNPTTQKPGEGMEDPNYISAPLSRAWADLFNTRYRLLLADLAHILTLSIEDTHQPDSRKKLFDWISIEMVFHLGPIAEILTTSPRHNPPQFTDPAKEVLITAGPPFALPYTLQLPDQAIDRWRQHEQVLAEAALRIASVKKELDGALSPFDLDEMSRRDEECLSFAREQVRNLSKKTDDSDDDDDDTDGEDGGDADEDFVTVGSVEQFPLNAIQKITVEGEARVLYHADPTAEGINPECPFYVSQLYCWHRHPETHPTIHCELNGTGVLNGKVVTCQTTYKAGCAHGSRYDITNGKVLQGPANRDLIMYATKCEGNQVLVARTPTPQDNG